MAAKTKACGKCRENKPVSEFHRNSTAVDNLQWACKSCIRNYDKQRMVKQKKVVRRKRTVKRTNVRVSQELINRARKEIAGGMNHRVALTDQQCIEAVLKIVL